MEQQSPSLLTELLAFFVRLMGIVMLIVGLVVGVKVILEAWNLYEEPQNIERFAQAIEQGSNLDQLINNLADRPPSAPVQIDNGDLTSSAPVIADSKTSLRLTYFIAWVVAILLLMIIGGLAMSAIRTGGQLALYDLQIKRFAKELVKQAQQTKD